MMKKISISALILTFCLLLSAILLTNVFAGSSAVEIASAEDFAKIADDPTKTYEITVSELDFTGVSFKAIKEFSGSISCTNGQCVIKNLAVDCKDSGTGAGIIGFLKGKVSGLVIDKSCSLINTNSNQHIGMIAGYADSGAVIDSCTNTADLTLETIWSLSGILGTSFGTETVTVKNCTNTGKIENTTSGEASACAGIVAMVNKANNTLNIENCTNGGDIVGSAWAGGILGLFKTAGTANLTKCINTADVTASVGGKYAGGLIAGCLYNKTVTKFYVKECATTGTVTGTQVAGIVGQFTGKQSGAICDIDTCYVRGTIISNGGVFGACGFVGALNTYNKLTSISIKNSYICAELESNAGHAQIVTYDNDKKATGTFKDNFCCVSAGAGTTVYGGFDKLAILQYKGFTEASNVADLTEKMATAGFIGAEGGYIADASGINGGCPVFAWQTECPHKNVTVTCIRTVCIDCRKVLSEDLTASHSFGTEQKISDATYLKNEVYEHTCTSCGEKVTFEKENTSKGNFEPVEGVYSITSAEELMWAAYNVKSGNIVIANDIILGKANLAKESKDYTYRGFGSEDTPFSGSINGNGKTITLKTDKGLIAVAGDCEIKNLTVISEIDCQTKGYTVGAVVDKVSGNAKISDITVNGKLNGFYGGGVVGVISENGKAEISDCVNNAEIWAYALDNASGSAGIVGSVASNFDNTISNCRNTAYITASGSLVAGIAGRCQNGTGTLKVENCSNSGKIASYGANQAGGIVGFVNYKVTVDSCINTGYIIGTNYGVGGIVGRCNATSNKLTVSKCVNLGKVDASQIYTGIVGYVSNGTKYDFSDNYSLGAKNGVGTSGGAKESVNVISTKTTMSLRLDNISTSDAMAKFTFTVSSNDAKKAGITFGDVTVGVKDNDSLKAVNGLEIQLLESKDEGGFATFTLLVKGIGEYFVKNDLTLRLETIVGDNKGFCETSVSLAYAASLIVKDGYKDTEGNTLSGEIRKNVQSLSEKMQKIVMIGDSITDGARSTLGVHRGWDIKYDRDVTYPGRLEAELGTAYTVVNCGYSGTTLCTISGKTYQSTGEYTEAINAGADIAFIMLGTNDADYNNGNTSGTAFEKKYKSGYINNAKDIIDTLKKVNPNVKIYIATSPESYRTGDTASFCSVSKPRSIYTQENLEYIRRWQRELVTDFKAKGYNIDLVDMHDMTNDYDYDINNMETSEVLQYFNVDLLHPGDRGYEHMAKQVAQLLRTEQ